MMISSTPSLGNFSVSLAVKDLAASRAFYEALGFRPVAGHAGRNMVILANGAATIGLFQGAFERNMLTFNPGGTPPATRSTSSPTCARYSVRSRRRASRR